MNINTKINMCRDLIFTMSERAHANWLIGHKVNRGLDVPDLAVKAAWHLYASMQQVKHFDYRLCLWTVTNRDGEIIIVMAQSPFTMRSTKVFNVDETKSILAREKQLAAESCEIVEHDWRVIALMEALNLCEW